jgi:xanthine dehydrogenase small subunit
MTERPIRFVHRGRTVEVADVAPTRTVLEWLREDARCTGTKEGCAEGDCGACTVVVGELDADGALALHPVNACIRFLPTLDGRALFTVEDLKPLAGGRLHPVQQAMVDRHGSQCGFCTPGFVMSMWSCYERHLHEGTHPTRQQLADDLSGNLCRCTGYRPILDAGERMFDAPPVRLDREATAAALRVLAADVPLHLVHGGRRFDAPRTLDDLAACREERPGARLLAGSTDIGLWVTKQLRDLGDLLYVGEVAEMRRVDTLADGTLSIGAAASLEDAWGAISARWPAFTELWLRFASPPIRCSGTMGGNLANGSPIGDSAPALMALDARLVLRRGARVRRLPLDAFYVDYMRNRLEPGEFVQAIEVPPPDPAWRVRGYKISKRFDSDISAVCAGLAIALDGDTVRAVRFAWGGMAATVRRAAGAEAAVVGRPWTEATLRAAQQALAEDFTPLTDMRGSAGYRRQVAQNLLERFWLETRSHEPLAPSAVTVHAHRPLAAA